MANFISKDKNSKKVRISWSLCIFNNGHKKNWIK